MMGKRSVSVLAATLLLLSACAHVGVAAGDAEVQRMTKEELKDFLGTPGVVVLDVRFGGDMAPSRIAGAAFEDPSAVASWAGKYPRENTIVLYCA